MATEIYTEYAYIIDDLGSNALRQLLNDVLDDEEGASIEKKSRCVRAFAVTVGFTYIRATFALFSCSASGIFPACIAAVFAWKGAGFLIATALLIECLLNSGKAAILIE